MLRGRVVAGAADTLAGGQPVLGQAQVLLAFLQRIDRGGEGIGGDDAHAVGR